ncbi:MAG TPA: PQQ-binding-like beta-propeller repeat protein [Gemmataceae bacterium]|jgi:outer membrane protein assembly factor BamB
MKSLSNIRRVVSLAGTALVFAGVVGVVALQSSSKGDASKDESKPSWPMYGGDLSRNLVNLKEKGIPTTWDVDKGTNVKWSVDLGSKAYGGPIVAGGRIYIGTNNGNPRDKTIEGDKGILMCFEEATGKFLWQAVHDKLLAGRVNDWPNEGICSSPVVEGDRLYYVNNRAEVVCADVNGMANGNQGEQDETYKGPQDVDVIWRLDMIGEFNVFPHNLAVCSPLIVGDTLFVVTANGVDEQHINIPKPAAPSFLAINKKTHEVIWKDNAPSQPLIEARQRGVRIKIRDLITQGKVLMHGQWSNPVYAEPNGKPMIIFPGGDGWMRAYNPQNGELLWKFDCNPKGTKYVLGGKGNRSDFVSTPVVWQNKLYIGVGQDPEHKKGVGHLWCIDITKQPKNKDKDLTPVEVEHKFDPKAAVNKDSGLVWHYGGKAPEEYQRSYLFGRTMSTCAVHDGLCYAADYDGYIYCLDANTGKKYWEDKLGADTWSSPYWVDGKIYIGTENGSIRIYKHGKTKELVNTVKTGADAIRATPVAVSGVLYVMTENPTKLWAVSTKK